MADPNAELTATIAPLQPARKFWPVLLGLWGVLSLLLAWNVAAVDLGTRGHDCGTPLAMAEGLWFLCAASGAAVATLVALVSAYSRGSARVARIYVVEVAIFFLGALIPLITRLWL